MDTNTLEAMKDTDIRTVDPSTLVDINDVTIDTTLTKAERLREFVRQIKNPYCYKCGKMVVKVEFAETDATLTDRLESYFAGL